MTLPATCAHPAPCGHPCNLNLGPERHSILDLGNLARLAVMIEPAGRGPFAQQARELLAQLHCLALRREKAMTPTTMMVFLRDAADEGECRRIIQAQFGELAPVTGYVVQPPCSGAALGVELWAAGGPGTKVVRHGPQVIATEADGIRWVHCGDIRGEIGPDGAYRESVTAFHDLDKQLRTAGVSFEQVVRTWIYVNQITEGADG